jgi:hypothetical protein
MNAAPRCSWLCALCLALFSAGGAPAAPVPATHVASPTAVAVPLPATAEVAPSRFLRADVYQILGNRTRMIQVAAVGVFLGIFILWWRR